jgi:predicted O-linked N-acetylglucosamine transferase (SPINDLY family)
VIDACLCYFNSDGDIPIVPPAEANLLAVGLQHHQAGRLAEAEACYQRVLSAQPGHADALHLLGIIAHQAGRHDVAVELINQAIKQNEQNAAYFCSLGVVFSNQGKRDEAVTAYHQAIRINPDLAETHSNLGNALRSQGKLDEALASYDRALSLRSDYAETLNNRGSVLHELERLEEALASYDRALTLRPHYSDALNNRGSALVGLKRYDAALASYDCALAMRPDHAEALNNRGGALVGLQRYEEALASYDRALTLRPDHAEALNNRGNAQHELMRHDEALASYDRALAVRPDHAEALNNRANALVGLKRYDEAMASYDRALTLRPHYSDALNNRGSALVGLKRYDEALAGYDRALTLRPDHAETLSNRGNALRELKRREEALASYDRALALRSDLAETLNNRGNTLRELNQLDEALASYNRALILRPDHAEALNNRGNALHELNRLDEALASYDRALAIKADHAHAFSGAADCAMGLCDWDRRTRFTADLCAHVLGQKSIVSPFVLLSYSGNPALQLQCARNYIENMFPLLPPPFWSGAVWRNDKIKIAYLSADFRRHPLAYLMVELFELHDRSRFEVIAVSFGRDDRSEIRGRLVAAFDQFIDVRTQSDKEVARLLNHLRIDIAVDLMGHTRDARPGILAFHPAPIQVSYLGFPGTTGADFIDYIIADAIVLPFDKQPYHTEKIVHLPDCYQVNDTKLEIAERTPTRQEMGLPEYGFVFCCFNNNLKITPAIFDIWMRLLHQVEGSVLWLLRADDRVARNLSKEAQRRGIDPSRLVLAQRLPLTEHLARQRLAGLFLDTTPYNAGATAAAALWSGLPVLSVIGETFVGRMGASLLHAAGVPELITYNLEDYQTLALKLARDSALLVEIKAKLVRNRNTYPLFNTERFARHIEAAYTTMWDTWQRGETAKNFSIEPVVGSVVRPL